MNVQGHLLLLSLMLQSTNFSKNVERPKIFTNQKDEMKQVSCQGTKILDTIPIQLTRFVYF